MVAAAIALAIIVIASAITFGSNPRAVPRGYRSYLSNSLFY
jgi:hypothetical protein